MPIGSWIDTARANIATIALVVALVAIPLAFVWGDHRGANRVIDRVERQRVEANAKANERNATAREEAAKERATDTATIEQKRRDQADAIRGETADDIRRNAACERLRQARGSEVSAAAGC